MRAYLHQITWKDHPTLHRFIIHCPFFGPRISSRNGAKWRRNVLKFRYHEIIWGSGRSKWLKKKRPLNIIMLGSHKRTVTIITRKNLFSYQKSFGSLRLQMTLIFLSVLFKLDVSIIRNTINGIPWRKTRLKRISIYKRELGRGSFGRLAMSVCKYSIYSGNEKKKKIN